MVDDLHWQFSPAGFFLLLRFVAVLANFRHGDVVPMSYKTQLISTTAEVGIVCLARPQGSPCRESYDLHTFPDCLVLNL